MKKIMALAFVLALVLAGCSSSKKKAEITGKDLLEKVEAKETFVGYIGTTTCSACIAFKPIVKELMKNYDVTIYSVMLDEVTDEEVKNQIIALANLKVTPTIFVIEDGEVTKTYEGVLEYRDLKKMLVDNGFLEE